MRIDHVMGLFRQFWVPEGAPPDHGAYVHLPSRELLAILCLEAQRAGAFVIGEDLGTVEPEVRTALADAGMLGTKVWLFDQDVEAWPERNLGTVTTHDLPTIAGVWTNAHDRTDAAGRTIGSDSELRASRSPRSPAPRPRSPRSSSLPTGRSRPARRGSCWRPSTTSPARRCGRTVRAPRATTTGRHRLPSPAVELLAGSPGAQIVAAMRAGRDLVS